MLVADSDILIHFLDSCPCYNNDDSWVLANGAQDTLIVHNN